MPRRYITEPKVPLGPLRQFLGRPDNVTMAVMIGTHRRSIDRYERSGIAVTRADEIAVQQLGVHPAGIWESWYEATA